MSEEWLAGRIALLSAFGDLGVLQGCVSGLREISYLLQASLSVLRRRHARRIVDEGSRFQFPISDSDPKATVAEGNLNLVGRVAGEPR